MPLEHYLQLAMTDGLGPITARRLIDSLGSAQAACEVSMAQLRTIDGIGTAKSLKIHESLQRARDLVAAELAKAQALGLHLVCPEDEHYPILLNEIPDPPLVLYVKGALESRDLNGMAIVGSRKCSYYGREQADRFAALLAGAGFTIISGGARGVDSAAHRGAMSHPQGRTIAVLGCGVDVVYPPENGELFEQIARRGAVISEYPLGTPPIAENFPRRNRLISGMSRGVLVVEADERSGALVTARQCIEDHNRPVFAIPGKIDNALSAGPHKLIREGATLTRSLEDVLEGLGPLPQRVGEPLGEQAANDPLLFGERSPATVEPAPKPSITVNLTVRQSAILEALGADEGNIDQLVDRTGLAAHEILQEMTLMSLKGIVKRVEGQTYTRASRRG